MLRQAAIRNLKALIGDAKAAGWIRLFSVRDEFPNEWAKFQSQMPAANERFEFKLAIGADHYPFWSKGRLISVGQVAVVVRSSKALQLSTFTTRVMRRRGTTRSRRM